MKNLLSRVKPGDFAIGFIVLLIGFFLVQYVQGADSYWNWQDDSQLAVALELDASILFVWMLRKLYRIVDRKSFWMTFQWGGGLLFFILLLGYGQINDLPGFWQTLYVITEFELLITVIIAWLNSASSNSE